MTVKVSDCIRIGTISKTHGVNGRVIVKKECDLELEKSDEPVFAIIDGLPVPLFVEESEERDTNSCIVKFELINTLDKAKEFLGCEIFNSQTSINSNINSQLIGLEIIDINFGKIGNCISIEPTKSNPLMIVETVSETIYIPIVDEWITEFVPNKHLVIRCPEGLLTINN